MLKTFFEKHFTMKKNKALFQKKKKKKGKT